MVSILSPKGPRRRRDPPLKNLPASAPASSALELPIIDRNDDPTLWSTFGLERHRYFVRVLLTILGDVNPFLAGLYLSLVCVHLDALDSQVQRVAPGIFEGVLELSELCFT